MIFRHQVDDVVEERRDRRRDVVVARAVLADLGDRVATCRRGFLRGSCGREKVDVFRLEVLVVALGKGEAAALRTGSRRTVPPWALQRAHRVLDRQAWKPNVSERISTRATTAGRCRPRARHRRPIEPGAVDAGRLLVRLSGGRESSSIADLTASAALAAARRAMNPIGRRAT